MNQLTVDHAVAAVAITFDVRQHALHTPYVYCLALFPDIRKAELA